MRYLVLFFALCFTSCRQDPIEPKLHATARITSMPAPFSPLTPSESETPWGMQYNCALHFAKDLDLFRAITAFKCASYLIPHDLYERKREIAYYTLYCYYLGGKNKEVIDTYERSDLQNVPVTFAPFDDLLIILNEAYRTEKRESELQHIRGVLSTFAPEKGEKLTLADALLTANTESLEEKPPVIADYEAKKKSPAVARTLNALLPGAGYLYLGQKQSAATSFLLNGLFIAAAVHFFKHGNVAAGAITTSLETGWYFGGIYGAGAEAKVYNEQLYSKEVSAYMQDNNLFPTLMFQYAF